MKDSSTIHALSLHSLIIQLDEYGLIEEDFHSLFTQAVRSSIETLPKRKKPEDWALKIYLQNWHNFNYSSEPTGSIVSCDGSVAESNFSGGLEAWVTRALAHIRPKEGIMTSIPKVEVSLGYNLEGRSVFAAVIELETLAEAIKKAQPHDNKVLAVYDGSLSPFLPARYMQRLQPLTSLFERYVRSLTECYRLAQKQQVELVGVSKDSAVTYMRARLILDSILQSNPDVGDMLRRDQRSLRLMARHLHEILERESRNSDSTLRSYLDELTQFISDEGLYSEVTSEAGYATPLLLGPQTRFFGTEVKKGTNDWWDSSFRRHLSGSLALSGLRKALDELYSFPPIAISYWKPNPGFLTYRIDVPSTLLGVESRAGDMNENMLADTNTAPYLQEVVSQLNWLSQGESAVFPLTEVDVVARLDRRLYHSSYEPIIIQELASKGHNARLNKRRIRDHIMRGY